MGGLCKLSNTIIYYIDKDNKILTKLKKYLQFHEIVKKILCITVSHMWEIQCTMHPQGWGCISECIPRGEDALVNASPGVRMY